MRYLAPFKVAALALSISACGGGSSSSSQSGGDTAQINVSGTASKGILANGTVYVYGVTSAGQLTDQPIGETQTDSKGDYRLEIEPSTQTTALKVVVRGDADATMICDAPVGCNDKAFGEQVAVNSGFELSAIIPVGDEVTSFDVNVNALTTVAERIASKNGYTADHIEAASLFVAQKFGIPVALTSIKAVDVTSKDSLENASVVDKRAAFIGAGVLDAVGGVDFETNLAGFFAATATGGGLVENDTDQDASVISVQDILESSAAVINQAEATTEVDLDSTQTEIDLIVETLPESEEDTVETPSLVKPSDSVVKAKELVADLRKLYLAGTGDLSVGAENFANSVDSALTTENEMMQKVLNADTQSLLEATKLASSALGEAGAEYLDRVDIDDMQLAFTSYAYYDVQTGEMLQVVVSGTGKNPKFSVKTTLASGEVVDLAAILDLDYTLQESRSEAGADGVSTIENSVNGSAKLTLDGSVANQGLSLTISNSSVTIKNMAFSEDSKYTQNSYGEENFLERDFAADFGLDISLNAELEQLNQAQPVSFRGTIDLTVDSINATSSVTDAETSSEHASFSNLSVHANGVVSQADQSFEVDLNLDVDVPAGLWAQTTLDDFYGMDGGFTLENLNETTSVFTNAKATVVIKTALSGLGEVVASLTAERTGLEALKADMEVDYDNTKILVHAEAKAGTDTVVTVTNATGVTLTTAVPEESRQWSGELRLNGELVGKIEEPQSGGVLARYTDGTFESLI